MTQGTPKQGNERFTLILPEKYRAIAANHWEIAAKFNYSAIVRAAIDKYYKDQGWLDE